jgi:hypothetical protein
MCVSIELISGADLQYAKHAGIDPSLAGADLDRWSPLHSLPLRPGRGGQLGSDCWRAAASLNSCEGKRIMVEFNGLQGSVYVFAQNQRDLLDYLEQLTLPPTGPPTSPFLPVALIRSGAVK